MFFYYHGKGFSSCFSLRSTISHFIFLSSLGFCGFSHVVLERAGRCGILWGEVQYCFFLQISLWRSFSPCSPEQVAGSLQRVRSQLEPVLPLRCCNPLLPDSCSWFKSGSSKEEVSISTAPNALWRYIFMTTRLIALFVPLGVWLLNEQPLVWVTSDFIARRGFAKTRRMRQPNWISGWNTLIYAR